MFLPFPPSYPSQIPGWPSLKLCPEFQNGPSISDWRHLDFGIISVIARLTGLYVCLSLPDLYMIKLTLKGSLRGNLNEESILTFHISLCCLRDLVESALFDYSSCRLFCPKWSCLPRGLVSVTGMGGRSVGVWIQLRTSLGFPRRLRAPFFPCYLCSTVCKATWLGE